MDESKSISYFSRENWAPEKRIVNILRGMAYAGGIVITILMLITVVHGTGRYAFNLPIRGITEISGAMVIITAFLIMAITQVDKSHIAIGVLIDRLSTKMQAIIDTITYSLCLVFIIVSIWGTAAQVGYELEVIHRTTILGIPQFPFQIFIAFGWGLIALALILQMVNTLHWLIRGVKK